MTAIARSAPHLEPFDGEELFELGRTSMSGAGWVAAVARVERRGARLVRIALWSPLLERWLRLDVHHGMIAELAELLARAVEG